MKYLTYLLCIFILSQFSVNGMTEPLTLYTTEAFFLPISKSWFEPLNSATDADIEYQASLLDMPDLPKWMHCRHPNGSDIAFLYGAPEEAGGVQIEIIALNRNKYETYRKVISFIVEKKKKEARHEVELKFSNLNVEDMFEGERLQQLIKIFENSLWRKSHQSDVIYVTMIASAIDVGGRFPVNPREKEGVVVRVGGTDNFSRDLLDLEREIQPLRVLKVPCPRDYKRTSAEHLFRREDFISDWCSFRLVKEEKQQSGYGKPSPSYSSIPLTSDDFRPQTISLPRRDFMLDFIVSIVVPAVVVVILLTSLVCVMCCGREGLEKRNRNTSSVQMNQYNSIQRASNQLCHLSNKRDSFPQSSSTPGSSLPRSRTGSPSSTLPKSNTLRSTSRTGTLRGTGPPPPPPYTPLKTCGISQTLQ
ncbi:epsilon-sarcoglycan isoform X1 [Centruroides vittatus]|uniref:epsilon-sarcoglycan isoform X1 n=1 Tax=Centruroides vittatus TaxID=120091 RepID=UPI00350FCD09